jgi:tetratricopeptide (TPR) repeat protein
MKHSSRPQSPGPKAGLAPSWGRRSVLAAVVLLSVAVGGALLADWWYGIPEGTQPTYVGRNKCIACHTTQFHAWANSHHDLAMDLATPQTVLGDFNDAELEHFGVTSRMFRRDGRYMIHTEGPDGQLADFEIKYVFGVDPLQQYMVEFDRPADAAAHEIGRVQVLRVSWDTRAKKWFYLSPPDVAERLRPDDDLHWTGVAQRWNNMCADCHSTNLQKNYDPARLDYHTTFTEIDVSCEACHGPGSLHVQLAESRSLFWDRRLGYALAPLKSTEGNTQIETCAKCHARRRTVHPGFRPGHEFCDYYAPELLSEHTYHADGQILDEVYEYGSYTQSKMYHKKVRCTDCHDPHTTKVKFNDNRLCTSCHQHPAAKYDSPAHVRHKEGSAGGLCVSCHMPSTTYMEVDPRRDHGMRVPRPDLSVDLGTPNACTGCHLDRAKLPDEKRNSLKDYAAWLAAARQGDGEVKSQLASVDKWARDTALGWYGPPKDPKPHFAHALAAAWRGAAEAESQLAAVVADREVAPIVRATAVSQLARYDGAEAVASALAALKDRDPLVRAAAVGSLQGVPEYRLSSDELAEAVGPLLVDPVRLVRTEAARILAGVPTRALDSEQRRAHALAIAEFEAGMLEDSDRAGAHLMLGTLYETLGRVEDAVAAYRTAMRVEPRATGPRTNLAALLDRQAEELVRQATQAASMRDIATASALAERADQYRGEVTKLRVEELNFLARDAKLLPGNAALQYRYGLALYLQGWEKDAEAALTKAAELEPRTPDFLLALALLYQKQQRFDKAVPLADKLVVLRPENTMYVQLRDDLRAAAARRRLGPQQP